MRGDHMQALGSKGNFGTNRAARLGSAVAQVQKMAVCDRQAALQQIRLIVSKDPADRLLHHMIARAFGEVFGVF